MQNVTPTVIAVLALELAPATAFGFAGDRVTAAISHWPRLLRILIPAVFCLPYAVVALHQHAFRWQWMILYILLPILVAALLMQASVADPEQRGNWRDALILLTLGLAVDLRWFDSAWPDGLRGLGNLLLLDAGLYGFLGIRSLSGTGFDFHFRWSDWKIGLRELAFFAPVGIAARLAPGFIHPQATVTGPAIAMLSWVVIFLVSAVLDRFRSRRWVR